MGVRGKEEIGKVDPWVSRALSVWQNGQPDWAPALHGAEVRSRVLHARLHGADPGGFAT